MQLYYYDNETFYTQINQISFIYARREINTTIQPARNLHKPSDPGGQNYPRAVEHRGRTPVDPGGHDPRVSR